MVRMARTSKSNGKAAAWKVDFKKRLDQLWDIGASDAIEVIRSVEIFFYVASKEEDIAFYIDQQDPRKRSMCGNY